MTAIATQIPSSISSFEVRCAVGQFIMDGSDSDRVPDLVAVGGKITITPDLKRPLRVNGETTLDARVVGVDALSFTLNPETGQLIHSDGSVGVELINPNDEHLDPRGWTYTATIAPEKGTRWTVTFGAPADGSAVVNLGALASVDPSGGTSTQPIQVAVQARDEAALSAQSAVSAAQTATGDAATAREAAEYAATIAYGQPIEVTDATMATFTADPVSATRKALDRTYRAHVSVAEYGAVGNGTADDTAAAQAALVAGAGGNVYFPPGRYRLTGNLAVPAGTTITGAGSAATLLDWSTKMEFDSGALLSWAPGTFTDPTPLAVAAAPGDPAVTVAEPHAFKAGDWVRVRADNLLWGEATPAEYQRILRVVGGVLTLSGPVYDTYALTQNAIVERANLPSGGIQRVSIRGKGINPNGYGDTAVHAPLLRAFSVQDVHFDDVENKAILLNSVLGASITDCFFRFDPSFTPLQYGVAITGGCQMISIRGCSSWNDRHMVTTSTSRGLSSEYRGVPRHLTITGCTAHGSWQAPIDTHNGGEYITVTGNALTSESVGIKIRGRRVVISGNSIVGKRTSLGGGARGLYIGMVGEDVRVTGNLISGFEDGIRFDTPNGTTRHLVVADNSIIDCNRCIYMGATAAISGVHITGNTMRAIAGGAGVFFFAPATDVDITSNVITGGQTGIFMSHPTNPVTRLHVQGNTCRGQSTRAMFFRFLVDAFIAGNFSTGEIRFTETATRVTTAMNNATITDLTTGTTVIQK